MAQGKRQKDLGTRNPRSSVRPLFRAHVHLTMQRLFSTQYIQFFAGKVTATRIVHDGDRGAVTIYTVTFEDGDVRDYDLEKVIRGASNTRNCTIVDILPPMP